MDDESGTVIATWPDERSQAGGPVPYAQETMHGMEYAFGQMLMAYGMLDEGIEVTAGVRDRYDGAKRNPWNEIECGSNYARSMASWGAMVVLAGFTFDATRGHIGFAPRLQDRRRLPQLLVGRQCLRHREIGDGSVTLSSSGATWRSKASACRPESGAVAAGRAQRQGRPPSSAGRSERPVSRAWPRRG